MTSNFIEVSGDDVETLGRHGIRVEIFNDAARNAVRLDPAGRSLRGLTLSWAGSDNLVQLQGSRFPDGRISCIGQRSVTTIHSDSEIQLTAWMYDQARLEIEPPRALFGLEASVYADTTLSIGPGCLFAKGVEVWTADHHSLIDLTTGRQINFPADVRIERDVWLSAGTMVLKGTTIGRGSALAARSMVTSDVPPLQLWGGSPARCLRRDVSWLPAHPASPEEAAELVRSLAGRSASGSDGHLAV